MRPFIWTPPWHRPGLLGFAVGGRPLMPGPFDALGLGEVRSMVPPPMPRIPEALPIEPTEVVPPPSKRFKAGVAQEEDDRRSKLVESWAEIVGKDLEASEVGRQVKAGQDEMDMKEAVRLSLAGKATSTLATRLSAVNGFLSWGKEWPPNELSAFRYLTECAGPGTPPSRAAGFLEAA
eukprot:12329527-Karenia_brevis.AAC.1